MRKSGLAVLIVIIILIAAVAVALTYKSNNTTPTYGSQTNNGSSSSNSTGQPTTGTINIRDMMFTPSQITVTKGGTVTWTNNDNVTHTVEDDLSNVGGPASGEISPGGKYSFTFNKTGSFQYHCRIHPSMRGTIVVK